MDRLTHSWIAIRAIDLLSKSAPKADGLVELLYPNALLAAVGAWIPDIADAKAGGTGSKTENHILKMKPYRGPGAKRFTLRKGDLLSRIGDHRLTADYLRRDKSLDSKWWRAPYKGDVPKPGQHLPNRVMALSTMLKDLLLMGDERVDALLPGDISFIDEVPRKARTSTVGIATYFFMLSHFVADASMPCHCDGRILAGYSNGLHMQLEKHWSRKIRKLFPVDELLESGARPEKVLESAVTVDDAFGIEFNPSSVVDIREGHDEWLEAVQLCRASFAVASIIAPVAKYPYDDSEERAPFNVVFEDKSKLKELDRTVLHDAVLNTAIYWKHIWRKMSKSKSD